MATITTEDLIQQWNLSEALCSQQISDQRIQYFCLRRGTNWESLCVPLEMDSVVVSNIKGRESDPFQQRIQFFETWKLQHGQDATYFKLITALLSIQHRLDAEYICELLQTNTGRSNEARRVSRSESLILTQESVDNDEDTAAPQPKRGRFEAPEATSESPSSSAADTAAVKILFAGKGKSTLFKNLFGEPMEKSKLQMKPFEWKTEKNGTAMHITTCNYGNNDEKKRLKNFKKNGNVDLLVYCLPVDQGTRFDDLNPKIIKCIHQVFGKDIWQHCVIVATYSDRAWKHTHRDGRNNDDQYMNHFGENAKSFNDELPVEVQPKATSIFVYAADDSETASNHKTIPIIPAGKKENDDALLPSINHGTCWTDEVFFEMCNKCRIESKDALLAYRGTT